MKPRYLEAVDSLVGEGCSGLVDGPISGINIPSGLTPPTEEAIQTKLASMISDWDAQEYARKREAEYPSIAELTVALYDTDDKAAIETKRAAVKAKYPKPA